MNKTPITATFRGQDGSMGYRNGKSYELQTWSAKSILPGHEGDIHIFVAIPDQPESEVEYESINSLTHNWEGITNWMHQKDKSKEGSNVKTLHNSTASQAKDNVKDIISWGADNVFKLISKVSSENEGWMKSTKAMEIEGKGCVVQVTTQQGQNVAEAVTYVPGVKILEFLSEDKKVVSRQLVAI